MTDHTNYKVLARRTRPTRFSELIGQESLSHTLKNALSSGRMAHAFIFTGTRGVGKTTTARLIALSLNCVGEDGKGGITSEPCGVCAQCRAIQEDRHVDVIEVDAATRTGVDDVRQLMEGMSYKPVMGRFKVYIIDEVHMLSKSAFNALLKTLEEPPEHVKFIFATTEIRKVPLTILSRCQRYDLKRVRPEVLVAHFKGVLEKEKVLYEDAALGKIAQLANGSVRDGLSILEQVITQAKGKLTLEKVEVSLGLLDGKKVEALFAHILRGEVKEALASLVGLYEGNADPVQILEDLLSVAHQLVALLTLKQKPPKESLFFDLYDALSLDQVMLIWTVLLKGVDEVKATSLVLETLEVLIIRAMYIQGFRDQEQPTATTEERAATNPERGEKAFKNHYTVHSFEDVISLFQKKKEPILADYLMNDVGLVCFKPGYIELNEKKKDVRGLRSQIASFLKKYTNDSWEVEFSEKESAEPLSEQIRRGEEEKQARVLKSDVAKAVTELFPGAKLNVT